MSAPAYPDHEIVSTRRPPRRVPRAAAVKDAAANAAASAEPAQSVLDRASTVLPFALGALHHKGVVRGYRPAFFRLIIGGRSLSSSTEAFSTVAHELSRETPLSRRPVRGRRPSVICAHRARG